MVLLIIVPMSSMEIIANLPRWIGGPDALILQRYYNAKDYVTGEQAGGWRIFPQRFLIIGKDPKREIGEIQWQRCGVELRICW